MLLGFLRRALSATPVLLWLSLLLYCGKPITVLAALTAILLHEAGHLLAFRLLGERMPRLSLHPLGLMLTPARMLSYRSEMTVALAGPLANLLTVLVCLIVQVRAPFTEALFTVSLLLSVIHLLPMQPLDGGRAASSLACLLFGAEGEKLARALSFATLVLFIFFSLYFLLYGGGSTTPFLSALLLFREHSGRQNA